MEMYEQLDIFSFLQSDEAELPSRRRLNVGDYVGRLVLGEVERAKIIRVEGNEKYFFYRTDMNVCFGADSRTDFEKMEKEAKEIRKNYKTLEVDKFEKFFAVMYPPRKCDGRIMYAMVGVYNGMLFWKKECTYQFLEPVKNIEKEYEKMVFEITHEEFGDKKELEYIRLHDPIPTKRLYWSKHGFYAEARYVKHNN